MTRYLVAVLRPHGFDPSSSLSESATRAIDALNAEMEAASVRLFVGGPQPTKHARCLKRHADGRIERVAGSGLVASDYLDGFWVLQCTDLDEALQWGGKAALACQASIEVRPFH